MTTARSKQAICSLVEEGSLHLEVNHLNFYRGIVVSADMLVVVDYGKKLQLHSRQDGKLVSIPHQLESNPVGVCLISNKEVAVFLANSSVEILSFQSIDGIKCVRRFNVTTGFHRCDAVAKIGATEQLVISGRKRGDGSLHLSVVSLTDGQVDAIHRICEGSLVTDSHLAIDNDTVYISCDAGPDSPDTGVYSYFIPNRKTRTFVYRHRDLKYPTGLTVDKKGYIFICNLSPFSIHQLNDRGQLVTIHKVLEWPREIFYEEQEGVIYITHGNYARVRIIQYRLDYSDQQDCQNDTTAESGSKEANCSNFDEGILQI